MLLKWLQRKGYLAKVKQAVTIQIVSEIPKFNLSRELRGHGLIRDKCNLQSAEIGFAMRRY